MALKCLLILLVTSSLCYSKVLLSERDFGKFIRPIYYDLHLFITGTTELRDYNGVLKLKFESLTNSNFLKIKTTTTTNITNVQLTNLNTSHVGNDIFYHRDGYWNADTSYTFKLNDTTDIIKELEVYELELKFTRHLHHHYAEKAVIMNKYNVKNVTKYFAFTRFKAEFFNQVMPITFEDILFKTRIKLRITHQPQYTALSNMPGHVVGAENDFVTTEFEVTPPMTAHLLAFAVGEFQSKPVSYSQNKSFTIHGSLEVLTKSGDAAEISGKILSELENYLETPYALPKIDYVIVRYIDISIEEYDRGLEPWGLILVQESEFFGDSKTSKTEVLMKNAILNAHLLARQYFGNLVTIKNWQFYWLIQGFGTFFSYFILDRAFPHNNYIDQFIADNMYTTFERYSHKHKVATAKDQMIYWYLSDKINIYKASSILRMLQHMVGEETFRTATVQYVTQNAYGSASPDDFIQAFENVLKQDGSWPTDIKIDLVINSWLENSGLPILTVTRNYESHTVALKQNYSGDLEDFKSKKWWIAYNYATKSKPDFDDTKPSGWMKQESTVTLNLVLAPHEWIIFNKQYTNLYTVNYDSRNWNLLLDELLFGDLERIHVFNRAQILRDLYQLVKWGKVDRKLLIKSLFYLRNEKNYLPWVTANTILNDYWKVLRLTKYDSSFKEFLKYITGTSYDHFRLNIKSNESKGSLVTRTILVKWACLAGHLNCIQDIDALSTEYLRSLNTTQTFYVHPDLKDDLFCYGFQNEEKYNRAFEYFLANPEHPDESQFFKQFTCKTNTALFRKYYMLNFDLMMNYRRFPGIEAEYPALDKVSPLFRGLIRVHFVDVFYQCLMENCYDFKKHYPERYPYEIRNRLNIALSVRLINDNDLPSIRKFLNRINELYGNSTVGIIGNFVG